MAIQTLAKDFPVVGDGSGYAPDDRFYQEELQLAFRNRGMPLEALRYDITPTGLHYLLTHYDLPDVNGVDWRLEVGGLVSHPLSLSLEEIKKLPAQTLPVTMECAGNGRVHYTPRRISQPWLHEAIGTAEWSGVPLRLLLEEAGLQSEAVEIVFTGLDRGVEGGQEQTYQRSLSVDEALRDEVLLAYAMNGAPLQPQHGYPLRLLVPGWYGMTSVKWLGKIEAVSEPFEGYQMVKAYRFRQAADDPGEPVSVMWVRALMIPPGIPEFLSRQRLVQSGRVRLEGKAWAGRIPVSRVDVSVDGGASWAAAELSEPVSPYAWRGWHFDWQASPGATTLCARATDANGNVQPMEAQWNRGGYGNNGVQRITVIVT